MLERVQRDRDNQNNEQGNKDEFFAAEDTAKDALQPAFEVSSVPRQAEATPPPEQPKYTAGQLLASPAKPISSPLPLQAKLEIGAVGDRYEREADRVANEVVQRLHSPKLESSPKTPILQDEKTQKYNVQMHPQLTQRLQRQNTLAGGEASKELEAGIKRARGGGQPLDATVQRKMGEAMGMDFSGVRVHTNNQAKAFTTGQDVFFKQGSYDPGSKGGQKLIAHELTHVAQQQGNTPSISSTSNNTIQRGEDHATELATIYDPQEEEFKTWDDVQRVKGRFDEDEWARISAAYRLLPSGKPIIRDRSNNLILSSKLDKEGEQELERKMQLLQQKYPVHLNILSTLTQRIATNLGKATVAEFYKGAHIVFEDGGTVYTNIRQIGDSIAVKNYDGSLKNKTDFVGKSGSNYGGWSSNTQDQRAGKMMARRPKTGLKETSHYETTTFNESTDDPQLGIDMPLEVGGHVLVGKTPDGDTFVQTEKAGFQSFWENTVVHLGGYFTVNGGFMKVLGDKSGMYTMESETTGTQSGLVGQTKQSEITTTEIREHDNPLQSEHDAKDWITLQSEALWAKLERDGSDSY